MKVYSVGIVDPHPIHAVGVKAFLSRNDRFNVVAIGHSASDIAVICARYRPDFLVTEIDMAGNPFQEIHNVALSFPSTKAIILTDKEQNESITQALAGKARGYVLKNRADIDLVKSFDMAISDNIFLSPVIAFSMMIMLLSKSQKYCSSN